MHLGGESEDVLSSEIDAMKAQKASACAPSRMTLDSSRALRRT